MQLAKTEGRVVEPPARARLEGPQLPEKAVAQEDVDSLLATMGF